MPEFLISPYFYLTVIVLYLMLVLSFANNMNVFSRIDNSGLMSLVRSKLTKSPFLNKLNALIKNLFDRLKNSVLKLNELILKPFLHYLILVLRAIAIRIENTELNTEHEISDTFKEVFTYVSLITRKTIEAEIQVIWSVAFLFMVLIYFILTM